MGARAGLRSSNIPLAVIASYAVFPSMWDKWLSPLGITLDPWQRRVFRAYLERKHIALCCSRQVGKSTIGAVLALCEALTGERRLVLLVSPSLRQSSELFRKVALFLDYLPLPQKPVVELNRLSLCLSNGSRIVSLPCSEQTIRGYSGVSMIIEDEASRVEDELYFSVRPMLATTNGCLILMSTPAGRRGHFWEVWEYGEGWEKIKITAEECPRISKEFLEQERKSLGDMWYRQEYECEFLESEGQVFRTEDLEAVFDLPHPAEQENDLYIEVV